MTEEGILGRLPTPYSEPIDTDALKNCPELDSYALGTDPVVNVRIPTAKLQGKPLAMSFKPATKADEDKILAMLPTPDDNGDIDPSKLPTYIPRDVNMKAEITLGNDVLASGNSYGFGSEVITHLGYEAKQGRGTAFFGLSEKVIRTGEYHAIGYDMQGMGQKQLEHTKNTLESIKTKLEDYQANKNQAVLDGITKHELAGSILQAGVQSYFALNDVQDRIAQQQQKNIIHNRFRSYGTFHTYLHPRAVYGMILGARLDSGMQMDIDRILYQAVAKDNNSETLRNFIRSQGPRESANEHLVPEQLFDNPETAEKEAEGISAVKAIQIAQSQGQTVFTITNQNKAEVLPQLNHDSGAMEDIVNALNAGHEVTTHQSALTYGKWTGSGYIIIDPNNGSGAYMISGGANGATCFFIGSLYGSALYFALMAFDDFQNRSFSYTLTTKAARGPLTVLFGIILTSIVGLYFYYKNFLSYTPNAEKCFLSGIAAGILSGGISGISKPKYVIKNKLSKYLLSILAARGIYVGAIGAEECFK